VSSPHEQPAYADRVWHGTVSIIENVQLARDTYRVRFNCPPIADTFLPGQFVMLRLADGDDPLLGRPLAIYNVTASPGENSGLLDIVYLRVGKMTGRLAEMEPGRQLAVWGPLGNGFGPQETDRLSSAIRPGKFPSSTASPSATGPEPRSFWPAWTIFALWALTFASVPRTVRRAITAW